VNSVPTVKVFKNALWTALRTIFWPKCTKLWDFSYNKYFSWGDTPGPRRSVPDAWTQTLIYSWLASVPIVPFLRIDH